MFNTAFDSIISNSILCRKSGSKYQDATLIEYQDFVSSQKLTGINFLSDKEVLKPMRIYVCDTILITMNPMEKKLFHLLV